MKNEYTFSNLSGGYFKEFVKDKSGRYCPMWTDKIKDAKKFPSVDAIKRFWKANSFSKYGSEYVIYENGRQLFDLKTGERI